MKKTLSIYSLLIVLATNAQTPANDPTWIQNTSLSDEFNGTTLDNTKWRALDCTTETDYISWGGATGLVPSMVSVAGGYLNLKVDGNVKSPNCNSYNYPTGATQYNTGGIISQTLGYSNGYLEMYAQMPGFIDGNGVAHGDKFWPAFWTYKDTRTSNCITYHDEIDVVDQCCNYYSDCKTIGSGWTVWDGNCSFLSGLNTLVTHSSTLCNSYHKYAVEWSVNRMIFYFDDIPFYENYSSFSMAAMKLVLDLQLNGGYNFYSGTPFPQYMKVDYLRYYTLRNDCDAATILNNTDLANYVFSVRAGLTIGNGSGTVALASTDSKTFRGNSITIYGDFTVPSGAELVLIPTNCIP